MPATDATVLKSILRQDFASFLRKAFHTLSPGQVYVPGWHIQAIAHRLQQAHAAAVTRLALNMPPRSLKSIAASLAFPAFLLGHDPTWRIICVSYSSDLARKHSNDFRALLDAGWHRDLFPATRIGRYKDSESEIELTERGYPLATSISATLTGRGGDIMIIDDPLSLRDVELILAERGVIVTRESIRHWCRKFGAGFAGRLRRRRPRPGDTWHLDEVFIRIRGVLHYLWRAVDQNGVVLDILVQERRNGAAATRFFKRLLHGLLYKPRRLVTDGLRSPNQRERNSPCFTSTFPPAALRMFR